MNLDYESWRCCHDDKKYCPIEGCPVTAIVNGKPILYGCARDHGWNPGDPSPKECRND